MGSHKDRPQITRLEIVDTGRRRRWSEAEKQRIIEESFSGRRLVSATARAHGISRSLLTTWRRLHREGRLGLDEAVSFAPVLVAPAAPATGCPEPRVERIEIVLTNGRRIIGGMDVDALALARVVSVARSVRRIARAADRWRNLAEARLASGRTEDWSRRVETPE
jgi:transposase